MPNLVKQRYVISNDNNKRVIDSNAQIEQLRLKYQVQNQEQTEEEFVPGIEGEYIEPEKTPEDYLSQAKAEAEEILKDAQDSSGKMISDAMKHAEAIRMEAMDEGIAQGEKSARQEWQEKSEQLELEYTERRKHLEQEYQEKHAHMEKELVETFLHVFGKVFHMQLEEQQGVLEHLIENALLHIESGVSFQVYASPEDAQVIQEQKDNIISQTGKAIEISVFPDPLMNQGECRIESDYGIYQCGIEEEYRNLTDKIRKLSE